jgi:chitin disaccharide deacetylase
VVTDLERLGFAPDARVVVVHVDDVGMCQAANAGARLALGDAATSGSVMVPCPAFVQAAALARERPELDLGVHLTLNCEFAGYRWGPVRPDVPSLCAPDGGMWPSPEETLEHADPEEVERELRAQVERALDAGIDVSHLDAHMGTVFHLKFIDVYARLAREFRVPVFIPRVDRERLSGLGMPGTFERYAAVWEAATADGFPVFDHFDNDSLHFEPGTGARHNRERLERLGPGLAYLITHCALESEELQRITPDWPQRSEECRIYSDGTMRAALEAEGIHTISMRPLRDLLRAQMPPRTTSRRGP